MKNKKKKLNKHLGFKLKYELEKTDGGKTYMHVKGKLHK